MSSELVIGVFWDCMIADEYQIRLRPLARRSIDIPRHEIRVLQFERQWAPPIMFRTVIRFQLIDGSYIPKVVIPMWARSIRSGLESRGWPVSNVQFGEVDST